VKQALYRNFGFFWVRYRYEIITEHLVQNSSPQENKIESVFNQYSKTVNMELSVHGALVETLVTWQNFDIA